MTFLTIDQDKCNRDGICVAECPSSVIQMDDPKGLPEATADASDWCLRCGHCVAVCPEGALHLEWLTPEACVAVDPALNLSSEQAGHFLNSRRSIRTFKKKPVPRETIQKLIEIACHAPSAKNMQPWHWIVVKDSAEVRRLAALVIDWIRLAIKASPDDAAQMGFNRVIEKWEAGEERICRGAPHVIVAHGDKDWAFGTEDCTLALSHLDLFARSLGLGICWGGYFYTAANHHPPLFEALGIPDGHKAYGAMMVGYPRFRYHRIPRRNPPNVTWI
ncbi:MAG: nitroreductase family protein [Deltaproteobacteria bacterium]|nr:nitroreductase family protein [Deltaproteobacteria bacterium]